MKGRIFLESFWAAACMGFEIVSPWRRKKRMQWGLPIEETSGPFPGDELVPIPHWSCNRGIHISVPAERVWPWVMQIGQGRGGFYSYQGLENLIGCKVINVCEIRPELQRLQVDDLVKLHPQAPGIPVAQIIPNRTLLLHVRDLLGPTQGKSSTPGNEVNMTWLFQLIEGKTGETILLSRTRYHYPLTFFNRIFMSSILIEPVSFVMERKMLREIRKLAQTAPHQV